MSLVLVRSMATEDTVTRFGLLVTENVRNGIAVTVSAILEVVRG